MSKKTSNPVIENPNKHFQDFKRSFESLAQTQSYHNVFSDFLDYSMIMLNFNKKSTDFEELERRWTNPREHKLFAEMFFALGSGSDGFNDCLGDIFMEFISGGRNGQFFTPQPICDLMAQLNQKYEDGTSICDPACGTGRTLLAVAKINRNLKFYAADNDIMCAKMTAINFLLNTMPGEVAFMDTLSLKHYKSWHIKKILVGTHFIPTYYTTGPNETTFVERLERSKVKAPGQGQIINPTEPENLVTNKRGQILMF